MSFIKNNTITKVADAAAAATTVVTSSAVDTANASDFTFCLAITTSNAGNYLEIQQADDNSFSENAEILDGTKVIAAANGNAVCASVSNPGRRYVRAYVTRTVSTATESIYVITSGQRVLPVTNGMLTTYNDAPVEVA